MNDIGERIGLYHNLFLICLVLALLCLVLAVAVFFILDIRSTLGYLTGRRAKKKIKELEAATAVSGRLMPKERTNMQYVAQEMKDDMGVRQRAKPGIRKVEHAVEAADHVTADLPKPEGTPSPEPAAKETALLRENAVEEAVDTMNAKDSTAVLEAGARTRGKFLIVRELMLIHTEEVI